MSMWALNKYSHKSLWLDIHAGISTQNYWVLETLQAKANDSSPHLQPPAPPCPPPAPLAQWSQGQEASEESR